MYAALYVSFMSPPSLHTLLPLCTVHLRRLTNHLYVHCHTLEEFSICLLCGLGVFPLQNIELNTFCMAALLLANNEQTLCGGQTKA